MKIVAMVVGAASGNADLKSNLNKLEIRGSGELLPMEKYSRPTITVTNWGRWSIMLPYIFMGARLDGSQWVYSFECAVGVVDFQVDERCDVKLYKNGA